MSAKFFLDSDDSGHWYIIPAKKEKEWQKFIDSNEDDEGSWDTPVWAKPVNGHPSQVLFENPEVAE
jgi:hypothetical protein